MTKQDNARDWQKDMDECISWKTRTTSFLPEIGIYWLQQYAEQSNETRFWKCGAEAERERAEKAEELLKIILPYVPKTVRDTYDIDSLYPESEGTK